MANGQSLCSLSATGSDKATVLQLRKLRSNSFLRFLSFLTAAVDFKLKSFFLLLYNFSFLGVWHCYLIMRRSFLCLCVSSHSPATCSSWH